MHNLFCLEFPFLYIIGPAKSRPIVWNDVIFCKLARWWCVICLDKTSLTARKFSNYVNCHNFRIQYWFLTMVIVRITPPWRVFYGNIVQFSLPICYFMGYKLGSHTEFYPDTGRLHVEFWLGLIILYRSELVLLSQICFALILLTSLSIYWSHLFLMAALVSLWI